MTWQPKNLTREQLAERRVEAARLLEAGEMKQTDYQVSPGNIDDGWLDDFGQDLQTTI